jgi:8-oxo-dGTP pyrophosphatase MutT (NUDIX family)
MSKAAPVISSRVVFGGRLFRTVVQQVRLPHRDRESQLEIVEHAGSVVIAAMPTPDSMMLVRQYRHPAGDWLWELPAGSIDPGEDAETAARRECHEELDMVAGTLQRLGELYPLPGYCTELMTFFRATDLRVPRTDEHAHLDEDESIEAQVFSLAQIRQMVLDGDIRDLKTAAGLLLVDSTR